MLLGILFVTLPLAAQQTGLGSQQTGLGSQQTGLAAQQTGLGDLGEQLPRLMLALSTADYPATPGDVYNLSYYAVIAGNSPQMVSMPLVLDAGYQLKVQNMGTVNARNKTYLQVRQEVEGLVSRNYPMSGPVLTLARIGNFTVLVTGETVNAGNRSVDGLTRVSVLLTFLTGKASIRFIKVTHANGTTRTCDLFAAARNGDLSQNPYIAPGDRILIPPAGRIVQIQGEVYRPGTYELLPGEELESLIAYYGDGFTLAANPCRIRLTRISSEAPGETRIFPYDGNAGIVLADLDVVEVENKAAVRPVVFFEGALSLGTAAVEQTGAAVEGAAKMEYPFYEGETLGNAARANAGRFTASSDLTQVYVIRNGEHIPMDLNRHLYYNDFSRDIALENGDIIVVPFRQYFVLVSGAVKLPGRYPYAPDRQADYYINLAGGRDELLNNGRGITITDMHKRTEKLRADTVIQPETMIRVPTNRFTAHFNQYGPIITTILSIVTACLTIFAITGSF
jgi:protein involved in polysaccharide export with SLBB domain